MDPRNYANTLKGAALYALDCWLYWKAYRSQNDMDEGIRTGNMQAHSAVLTQITGEIVREGCADNWRRQIDAMEPITARCGWEPADGSPSCDLPEHHAGRHTDPRDLRENAARYSAASERHQDRNAS